MAISSRRQSAFTLVELLVVITIIGMLVALLLPAINGARERGRQLDCLNNIKQLGTAAISHDSSMGQLPGFTQFVKRTNTVWANVAYDNANRQFKVINSPNNPNLDNVYGLSWATKLLSRLERSDIWDQIVQPASGNEVIIPPMKVFICPSDRDLLTQPDLAGLSYSANTGGWDLDGTGSSAKFLYPTAANSNIGDTAENGVFFDLAQYDRLLAKGINVKGPKTRLSGIKDGAGTTLMFAENIHKSYDPLSASSGPAFGWLFGNEQQLGFVWVVSTNAQTAPAPVPGNTISDQERINGTSDLATFDPTMPRFARPGSAHSSGVNVVFCDGHGLFLRDDIDYVVYQQLMTTNGRKSVNPANHADNATSMNKFQTAPPLAEKDYL